MQKLLKLEKFWEAIKKEIAKEKQELTPYSFRLRYAYYGHNRAKADESHRAPKLIAEVKAKIYIKLPNDILLNNKKVCGILQEIIFRNNLKYLIVGIGINVSSSPKINNYPTTFLNNYTNKKLKRLELFKEIKLLYEKNLHAFGV